jgi:CheY-like chemotaxis protein
VDEVEIEVGVAELNAEEAALCNETRNETRNETCNGTLHPLQATADLLIIDDDPQLLRMMDRTVRSAGFTSFTAPSPAYALELLRTTRFQMLVLDVSMPMQTGIELAQEIRRGRFGALNRDVPIVFVTADNRATTYEQTFDVEALRCLIKPFDSDRFCRIVESLVERAA